MQNITLVITGMTCANCAVNLERQLKKLKGVISAKVNFASEKAAISFEPEEIALSVILQRIQALGFDIATERINLFIEGISDVNDARRLEVKLNRILGVSNVEVDVVGETMWVDSWEGLLNADELLKIVNEEGFKARLISEKDAEDFEKKRINEAYRKNFKLLGVGLFFTIPLFFISMSADMGLISEHINNAKWLTLLMFFLALPVQIVLGMPHYKAALNSIRAKTANMDVLVCLGSSAAFLYSIPVVLNITHGHVYFETAAVILTLIRLGKTIEAKVKAGAGEAIRKLVALKPQTANRLNGEKEELVHTSQLKVGDLLRIRPGEAVPTDGVIKEGEAYINEAILTGESMPKKKQIGDTVFGSTLNEDGFLVVEVTKVGGETMLSRIIRLMEDAQASKPAIQRLADRVASIFVPAVIVIAALTFLGWWIFSVYSGAVMEFSAALMHSVAVLVIACPCAMGLATPTAVMAGTGRAAGLGVLIRSGEALERAGRLDVAVFDKTGTITIGKPTATIAYFDEDSISGLKLTIDEAFRLSASLENASKHPVAQAVVATAMQKGIELTQPKNVNIYQGFGISGEVDGYQIDLGNSRLMMQKKCTMSKNILESLGNLQSGGTTGIVVAINQVAVALISVADAVKPEASTVVKQLAELGIDVMMLSGDNLKSASAIATMVGIKKVIAEVLPQDKLDEIKRLQVQGKVVAMIGDGINDAPALSASDIGISMGAGSDIAMAATPIILTTSDLTAVPKAIVLSRLTFRTIKQNLFWAFFYNIVLIPAAAFGILNPMLAALSMAFSSVFVVMNSLRLKYVKL